MTSNVVYKSRTCVLHLDRDPCSGEVKLFDETTWFKVTSCDSARREKSSPSKYLSIKLPDSLDDTIGYHVNCYSNFTAMRCPVAQTDNENTKLYTLRSGVAETAAQSSSSGIFPSACIFCNSIAKSKGRYRKELPGKCETQDAAKAIYDAASKCNDETLLARICGIDMVAEGMQYHHSCKRNYLHRDTCRAEKAMKTEEEIPPHDRAFCVLKRHIQETLIDSEGAELLTSLHNRYMDSLGEETTYSTRSLGDKIAKNFPELKITKQCNKEGNIVYSAKLSEEAAIKRANFDLNNIVETAYYLRGLVKDIEKRLQDLPQPLSAEALTRGQAEPPADLVQFFSVLYTGSTGTVMNDRTSRLTKSVSSDVMYATSHGKIKTGKHLTMGLGIKSLTGSKKVINILNRMGHCVCYATVEELETQLATEITERKLSTPDGLLRQPNLMTSLAWDNYDENTETLSGSGTVHDTVGICYQNVRPSTSSDDETNSVRQDLLKKPTSKRRTFMLEEKSLEPYRKKPKMSSFEYPTHQIERPLHVTNAEWRDMLWMITINLHPIPHWTGWNSLVTEDPLPLQKIQYMENITLPPTQMNVVLETLKVSQRVAAECGQEYAVVTYDLAIAKPAMQIQAEESPRFDNLFICFGAFHIALAYLGCLGFFIDGSGGPNIVTDSGILATGSLRGFLLGKHYNRCKRIHPLFASALTKVHFKAFLDTRGPLSEAEQKMLEGVSTGISKEALEDLEKTEEYYDLMCEYESYCDDTFNGKHGATQQYWMMYIKLVQRLLLFIRACRTNDIPLFIYALEQMIPVFFAGNRPNYSRWMVKYHMNLLNCEESHPGIMQMLQNGAFTLRRTNKAFSRTAVDMALEQTVNADAASRHTGMGSFIASKNARGRWMVTRSIRSAIVGSLMDSAGMNQIEDSTKDTQPHRVKRDHDDLMNLVSSICSTMNPFNIEPSNDLFCLSSGKKVRDDIKKDLLSFIETGEASSEEFRKDCLKEPSRFEKPIKRKKLKNFSSASVKSRLQVGKKVQEISGTRDLFGRLLLLSTLENIDLEKVLKYPLTPVPLSLAHIDGSMNSTDKSRLMHKLETFLDNQPQPSAIDAYVIDATFFLHLQKNPPMTFGALAKWLLQQIVTTSKEVHLVCDVYATPSIKDAERERRGNDVSVYIITGPDQIRPKDWQVALRSSSFKTALFQFLETEWKKPEYVNVIKECHVYMNVNNECVCFSVDGDFIEKTTVESLKCDHEEADTRMVFHLDFVTRVQSMTSVVIRSCDTDVLIILLHYVAKTDRNVHVWMDAGRDSNNTRRLLSINNLVQNLTKETALALPGLHALTGCDYIPAFLNKGKVKPFELMVKDKRFIECMTTLGQEELRQSTVSQCETFVCHVYGQSSESSVNNARFQIFKKTYAPKSLDNPLASIKGINPSSLPPCAATLQCQLKRANYVAAMWKCAHLPSPGLGSPDGHGWVLQEQTYRLDWFEGDQLPKDIYRALEAETELMEEEVEDEDVTYGELLYGADEVFEDED